MIGMLSNYYDNLHTIDVLQRWELLQARMMDKDYRISQIRQDWGQFRADLDHMLTWLDEIEALHSAQETQPRDITELDSIIRQHKVCIMGFLRSEDFKKV